MLGRNHVRNVLSLASMALAMCLAGCNATVEKKTLDRDASSGVRRIAIVQIPEPRIEVMSEGSPAMYMFGAVGAAVASSGEEARNTRLGEAIRAQKQFPIGARMTDALATHLTASGYLVVRLPGAHEFKDGKFELQHSRLDTDADAILSVSLLRVGYHTWGWGDSYTVLFAARVELVRRNASGYARIYADNFWVENGETPDPTRTHIPAPKQYRFSRASQIVEQSDNAVEGLIVAGELIAKRVAQDLMRAAHDHSVPRTER
jgi:hypothetical protein